MLAQEVQVSHNVIIVYCNGIGTLIAHCGHYTNEHDIMMTCIAHMRTWRTEGHVS